jgi:hypothetical protein
MNPRTDLSVDPMPAAEAQIGRRPLYLRWAHWFARTGYGLMLLLYLGGVVSLAIGGLEEPVRWHHALGVLMLLWFPFMIALHLRTWTLYGSMQGVEIARWGTRRLVPWSRVGKAEYAWWSLNYAARLARLTLYEERSRTILFFANDRILAEIETMRSLYAER